MSSYQRSLSAPQLYRVARRGGEAEERQSDSVSARSLPAPSSSQLSPSPNPPSSTEAPSETPLGSFPLDDYTYCAINEVLGVGDGQSGYSDGRPASTDPATSSNFAGRVASADSVSAAQTTHPDQSCEHSRSSKLSTSGFQRQSSPSAWTGERTEEIPGGDRVLLIDYLKQTHPHEGLLEAVARGHHDHTIPEVVAWEARDLSSLYRVYPFPDRKGEVELQVILLQNTPKATEYFLKRFGIACHNDLAGAEFSHWAKWGPFTRRAAKSVLSGKLWETQHYYSRGINRCFFSFDYLKYTKANQGLESLVGLDGTDAEISSIHDLVAQIHRCSVYIQLNLGWCLNSESNCNCQSCCLERTDLESRDNGSTVVIFDNSASGFIEDTLIPAPYLESRWDRLTFLSRDFGRGNFAPECVDHILTDIFKAVLNAWEDYVQANTTHVSGLEGVVYESPADESHAPELWACTARYVKAQRLMKIHKDIIRDMKVQFDELTRYKKDAGWLSSTSEELERLIARCEEDLIGPTIAMSDIIFKAVAFRDARQSLQLSTSLWRLSWITFIFLPLTFTVGFFGMNVDIFEHYPSVKWYFVTAVPLMVGLLLLQFSVKHISASRRLTPYQRTAYVRLYRDMATKHPDVWSPYGPRTHVTPKGMLNRIKWRLLSYWFTSDYIFARSGSLAETFGDDELAPWTRAKNMLLRRWLAQIDVCSSKIMSASIREGLHDTSEPGNVSEPNP